MFTVEVWAGEAGTETIGAGVTRTGVSVGVGILGIIRTGVGITVGVGVLGTTLIGDIITHITDHITTTTEHLETDIIPITEIDTEQQIPTLSEETPELMK